MKLWLFILTGALILLTGALVASQPRQPRFPHEEHERLFPVCGGCHSGVESGVAEELYPQPQECARCHDGQREERVDWSPPGPRESNLRFFHPAHVEAVAAAGDSAGCLACHASGASASPMSVAAPQPALCIQCHAHAAEVHLAPTAECRECHVPLTEAQRLPRQRLAGFPRPATHEAADFVSRHAPDAPGRGFSCGVCHARESCERCHVNADRVPAVAALLRDPRVAALVAGKAPEYPPPQSHRAAAWDVAHGKAALDAPAACANCHTRPSCTGCHAAGDEAIAALIRSLPLPGPAGPRGVELAAAADSVHPADFATRHGSWAASGALQCTRCHAQPFCSECHAGQDSRAFHPANFVERHAVEVMGGSTQCQSCHSTQTFCQACHEAAGFSSGGQMTAAFHTGQALWVLSHGQAARSAMESCASCHRQNDCLQCHSAAGGWGVSPHGPGFSATRSEAASPGTCRLCHLGDPPGGG